MKLVLVDDHQILRDGLRDLFSEQVDVQIVGECATAAEAIQLLERVTPDVVLLDWRLPDGAGSVVLPKIRTAAPRARTVVLTASDEPEDVFQALAGGAVGYIIKGAWFDSLVKSLQAVMRGEIALSRPLVTNLAFELQRRATALPAPSAGPSPVQAPAADHASLPESEMLATLTKRERVVLQEMAQGARNKEIARRLVISEHTVRSHVTNILAKLGVPNRTHAARLALAMDNLAEGDPAPPLTNRVSSSPMRTGVGRIHRS